MFSNPASGNPWVGLSADDDPQTVSARVAAVQRQFLECGTVPLRAVGDSSAVRPFVLDSWLRSKRNGVVPEAHPDAPVLDTADLRAYREAHPLRAVLPVVHRLLIEDAGDSGFVVAMFDRLGRVLWLDGDRRLRDKAARVCFVEGADWSEDRAGTSAPGTALRLGRALTVFESEHFTSAVRTWSCAAAPVHDPVTGHLLGVVDISGGPRAAAPEALALVRATALAAESELRLRALATGYTGYETAARLSVLGTAQPHLRRGSTRISLSQRHAEILLLLSEFPEGLSADHLGTLLDRTELDAVTIRAEMSRLRKIFGASGLGSRPYRLLAELGTDVDDVRAALDAGDAAVALRTYTGPVLPRSFAPGIEEVREDLRVRLRALVVQSGDPHLLARWTASTSGRDDAHAWRAYLAALDRRSPLYAQVQARIGLLDRRLGI